MFHMLVCFDLKPGVVIDEFRNSVGGSPSICEASISRLASAPLEHDKATRPWIPIASGRISISSQ